ncbi:putative citrate lyase beta subunit [Luminiphilus syltensis NOR5-1B]|uniref:Putative citrate lyase beta subunit n=1 Tax=Luminiphilus syltensis NOR5-1B TaxID=565045 RepID=B8KTZ5_9GAMM|nr:CoA ester lyase [Luminiphilus syltensis]EED35006.1 putative citrate lyase beta subunit [Luminiphilus syltensis NOR5-1B]
MPTDATALSLAFQTLLFVPGSRMDRVAKAHATDADIVAIDLEDAVPEAEKDAAREGVLHFLATDATVRTAVRINGLRTRAGLQDLLAFSGTDSSPGIVLVPMVESPVELDIFNAAFNGKAVSVVPIVETVKGLSAVVAIGQSANVANVMFGGGDFSSQMGVDLAWEPLFHARSRFVMQCVEAGVRAVDVPYIHIKDDTGLEEETQRVKSLGFSAKALIHPNQAAIVKTALKPTASELERAAQAVAAYHQAGGGAIMHQGVMLDEPIVRRMESLLKLNEGAGNA